MAISTVAGTIVAPAAPAAASGVGLLGAGSSFAGPEISQWTIDTSKAPYNLNIAYTSSSSADGRYEFAGQTVDYGVTDIEYQPYPFDTASPKFPFIYVPVTAGGLSFMYHIAGLSGTLQLSSYSACAIFTGGVTNWDSPVIQADNPGVSLPDLEIHPVIRSDLSGTNFVFQEWCIDEEPALWSSFVNSPTVENYPGQVGDLSATQPRSDWPIFPNAISQSGSANAADTVADPDSDGYITAVETAYALQRGFPVASVKNASGYYTQPTAVDVASALAYATQQPNGTHILNFGGIGPHVYNPSTYSYMLIPTTGWSAAKGNVISQFVDYDLTLGQHEAPEIGYASLGLSLERYGVNQVESLVAGAVGTTSPEAAAYACGDLTPAEVQAGQTQPTCGVVNATATTPASTNAGSTVPGSRGAGVGGNSGAEASSSVGGGSAAGGPVPADPAVSLSGIPGLAFTGGRPIPIAATGGMLFVVGFLARRRLRARSMRRV
ncbi:MAG TPA: substrate-binding domain-containing protein [Acidimicrobiales bacterium]|nr:substrate-binding domain-containing protein [Acidimicrobiales bacterium]